MISTESFSKEWIEGVAQKYGYHDKELLEKVIRAFALLETRSPEAFYYWSKVAEMTELKRY